MEETNENGHTPLVTPTGRPLNSTKNYFSIQMEAAGGGHVEVTQVLLDHGAGVNVPSKDSTAHRHRSSSFPKSNFLLLENGNEIKERKTDEMHTGTLFDRNDERHRKFARFVLQL